jgi:hypothetical protein
VTVVSAVTFFFGFVVRKKAMAAIVVTFFFGSITTKKATTTIANKTKEEGDGSCC